MIIIFFFKRKSHSASIRENNAVSQKSDNVQVDENALDIFKESQLFLRQIHFVNVSGRIRDVVDLTGKL